MRRAHRPAARPDVGDRVGTIEPGRRANLLVLGADPTVRIESSTRIRFVIKAAHRIAIQ